MNKIPCSSKIFRRALLRGYQKENKLRNYILLGASVSVIVLSMLIFCLVYGKYQSDKLKNEYIDGRTISTYIEDGTESMEQQLKQLSYIEKIGKEKIAGKLMNNQYTYCSCVVLDRTAYQQMIGPAFMNFVGNYPQKDKEIMLSKKTLEYLGIKNPKIGMKISLDFYWNDIFVTDMTGKQEFILSGYYENNQNNLSEYSLAYISKERMEKAGIEEYPCRLLIDPVQDRVSGERMEMRLRQDILLKGSERIVSFDSASYRAVEGIVGNYIFAYLLIFLILFCMFFLIYNILYISFEKELRQYGLLRAVGATVKQIKRLLYLQVILIWIKSSVIGGICSYLLNRFFVAPIMEQTYLGKYRSGRQLEIFLPMVFVSFIVLVGLALFLATFFALRKLISFSPIEAIHYQKSIQVHEKISMAMKRIFIKNRIGVVFRMALYNVMCNKKKFMFIIVSLFVGCETAFFSFVLTEGMNQMNRLKQGSDFTITIPEQTLEYLVGNTPEGQEFRFISQDSICEIEKLLSPHLEDVSILRGIFPIVKNVQKNSSVNFLEDDSLPVIQKWSTMDLENLSKYVKKENINVDLQTFKNKNGVLILHNNLIPQAYQEEKIENIGKTIEFNDLVPVGTSIENLPEQSLKNCGYIDISEKNCPSFPLPWKDSSKVYMLVSDDTFRTLSKTMKVQDLQITLNVEKKEESTCKQRLKNWIQKENMKFQSESGIQDFNYYSMQCKSDVIAKETLYIQISQFIMYLISAVLLLMGLTNYFTSISTTILIRKREFAILESVGMTKNSMKKMLLYEGFLYAVAVIFLLLTIGNIMMFVFFHVLKQNVEYFIFRYPFCAFFVLAIALIFICSFIPRVLLKIMQKESLVERIQAKL